jgi:chitinase
MFPPPIVQLSRLSDDEYIFSETTSDPSVLSLDSAGASFIPNFVQLAKQHNTMASISVGGWSGSGYFSTAVAPQNRSIFSKAILDMVSKYNFDGVDIE